MTTITYTKSILQLYTLSGYYQNCSLQTMVQIGIFTPRACAKGKVIGCVVIIVIVVSTKIAISRDVGV